MKIVIVTLTLLLSIMNVQDVQAQSPEAIQKMEQSISKKGKYALLVMKAQHLKAGILTGQNFKRKSQKTDFQIIVCGEVLKEISKDEKLQQLVKQAIKEDGLKILSCGLSIEQLSIDKSLLPSEMPITENGLIYLFGLQENGYKTIAL